MGPQPNPIPPTLYLALLDPLGQAELHFLTQGLQKTFSLPCESFRVNLELRLAYDENRGQFDSQKLLDRLRSKMPPHAKAYLAITEHDLFSPHAEFVYGESLVGGPSVVSFFRFDPAFYHEPPAPDLFRERLLKEAIFQVGKSLQFSPCPQSWCVMHLPKSIADLDRKKSHFCPECLDRLKKS